MYIGLKQKFEIPFTKQFYYRKWNSITFFNIKLSLQDENKQGSEIMEIIFTKFQKC